MKVTGIIAEYNPFHNGHLYQLNKAKELSGADYTVVVMSGSFVQRGAPAIFNKYLRTEAALKAGADLVLELPVCFSTGSAEYFSDGAVAMLNSTGITDFLCFGSEDGSIEPISATAEAFLHESDFFKASLKEALKEGVSYPKARAIALSKEYPALSLDCSLPNNLLGIEYCKSLKKTNSSIKPVTVKRLASEHNSDILNGSGFCSASALRNLINGTDLAALQHIYDYIPKELTELYNSALSSSSFLNTDDLSNLISYRLALGTKDFSSYLDVSEELANRIENLSDVTYSFSELCTLLKTKEITLTRIQRALLHILFNITTEETEHIRTLGTAPYLRVLGFKKSSAVLLKALRNNCDAPVIQSPASDIKKLPRTCQSMLLKDMNATHLYNQLIYTKTGIKLKNEYIHETVILSDE